MQTDYERFLRSLLKHLLTHPEHLVIKVDRGSRGYGIQVQVYGEDQAFVIGRQAKMVKSIQFILGYMGMNRGQCVQLGILDPQVGGHAAWRQFVPDRNWTEEKQRVLIESIREILEIIFDRQIGLTAEIYANRTEVYCHCDEPMEINLLVALRMILRSVGKSMRRDIGFNVKSP
jgi:predicted RNA-binding protein YlqC (UPF0109 family)